MTVETRARPSDDPSQANMDRVRHALASGARPPRAGVL